MYGSHLNFNLALFNSRAPSLGGICKATPFLTIWKIENKLSIFCLGSGPINELALYYEREVISDGTRAVAHYRVDFTILIISV